MESMASSEFLQNNESQNCINRCHMRLSGPFSPNPGSKQVCLEQAAQAHLQVNAESLQGQRYHNLFINPIPVFYHSDSKHKTLHNSWEYSTSIYFLTQTLKIYNWFEVTLIIKKSTSYSLLCSSQMLKWKIWFEFLFSLRWIWVANEIL